MRAIRSEDMEYPIPVDTRPAVNRAMVWRCEWWLSSEFRLLADKDVRAIAFDLFCIAQHQNPLGTLPTDERILARLVGEPMEEWHRLMGKPVNPLSGWRRCILSNGDRRLYHPVSLEIARAAFRKK